MNHSSQIIFGGGWKDARGQNIKIKAWCTLFVAIVLGGVAVAGPDWLVLYAWVLAGISLSLSVLLLFRERPTQFPTGRSGSDLEKLYGTSSQNKKQP